MYRNLEKPYHIDYVFASHGIIKNGYKLTFGNPTEWIDKSDHVPMILDIKDFVSKTKIQHTFYDFTNRHLNSLDFETKSKFETEIKLIESLAEKLDLLTENEKEKMILTDKIETLKTIDKLTKRLKKNEC